MTSLTPAGSRPRPGEAASEERRAVGLRHSLRMLDRSESRTALRDHFRIAVRPYGFNAFAAGYLPEPGTDPAQPVNPKPFLMLDWPGEWLELYARQGFAGDDVTVAEARRSAEPFTWSEIQARRPGTSARVFAAASGFGWNDGFVVPVHDPAGAPGERAGIVNLAAAELAEFDGAARGGVVRLAQAAFARAAALSRNGNASVAARLPPREREALALVAQGLDDAGIAERMRISRATAHAHVEGAKRRLGATTRAQAVAIALNGRLLEPS